MCLPKWPYPANRHRRNGRGIEPHQVELAAGDELRFREYIYSLLQRCARANVSIVMTQEVRELFGVTHLSEYGISHLSDNVILLQFVRGDSQLKRALTVLKARGSAHDPSTRQYEITTNGIVLGDHFGPSQAMT